jgi:hypothetical protein
MPRARLAGRASQADTEADWLCARDESTARWRWELQWPACRAPGGTRRARRAQVLLGMIWVWPESGPVAFIESAAAEPAVNQRVKDVDPGTF